MYLKNTAPLLLGAALLASPFEMAFAATKTFNDAPNLIGTTSSAVSCSGLYDLNIVSASDNGTNDGNGPSNVLDNNYSTRWSSQGLEKKLVLSLANYSKIKDVKIAWHNGNQRRAYFEVDASTDGNTWFDVYTGGQSSGNTTGLQTFNISDVSARYVRIVGQGNSSNNWNSILEARVVGCTNGSSSGGSSLNPNVPPSGNFDLLDWTISVPVDNNNDGKADTIKENQLNGGYSRHPYFFTAADGGMVFRSYVKGPKTSTNTKFTRSELREMLRRGNTSHATKGVNKNNWVFGTAPSSDRSKAGGVDGTLTATLAVNKVTTNGDAKERGRVVIGQIHANDDEPVRLYYRKLPGNSKGSIYFAHEPRSGSEKWVEMIGSRSDSASNPSNGIALNEKFSYRIRVTGNTLAVTIMRPGKSDITRTVDMKNSGYTSGGQYMYFKAGVYLQDRTSSDSQYAQATFYSLSNKHSGYAF